MKIRGHLAPYPLLAKTNDSYRKSSFDGIAELKASGGELRLEFRAVLRCTSLRNLVRAGLAGYALHVESPVTSYRRLFEFNDAPFHLTLAADEVRVSLQVTPFVVAKAAIEGYASDDFHEAYEGQVFSFARGHILAVDQTTEFLLQAHDERETLPSIVRVEPLGREAGEAALRVDCGSDYIVTRLPQGMYDAYRRYAKGVYSATFLSCVVQPALTAALEKLQSGLRAGEEPRTRWQRVLVHLLEEEKLDVAAKDAEPLAVAQRLLRDPLNRAVQELEDLAQREEVGAWN
ncbi:hypothetical protein [uncultured Selenomonas sp.]|uniref:hypothetical protein n=1 Tax=uncultured Selenomonas sp. TaxID=159275 RepID=UPI0025D1661C|nr:hypothetical protein [uncultured Selenomonas sp.]